MTEFAKYFNSEDCWKLSDSEYYVTWTTFDYTNNGEGDIDEYKWENARDFVLYKLLRDTRTNRTITLDDIISNNGYADGYIDLEYLARAKLVAFTVSTDINLNDSDFNKVYLALTFYSYYGYEDCCKVAICNEYADSIIAEAKKIVSSTYEI